MNIYCKSPPNPWGSIEPRLRTTAIEPQKVWKKIDRDDLFVWDDRTTRGHKKKLKLKRTTTR